jgi:hypothetical protein
VLLAPSSAGLSGFYCYRGSDVRQEPPSAMTIREEIVFSIFVAAAMVMGWKLVLSTLDYVLK